MDLPVSRKRVSRRTMLQTAGVAALAAQTPRASAALATNWPLVEGPQTPKIGLGIAVDRLNDATARKLKQLGVSHVLGGGPQIPWQTAHLKSMMDNCKAAGLTLGNLMIGGFPNTIYGKAGRDEEIDKVRESIRAAGSVGLAVVEYNFYAHRAMEGYYGETGRSGSGYTSFDYERMKGLPAQPNEGAHSLDEMWKNVTYFLQAVVPVAKESNVRLALHPNDPPAPLSRGSGQIMATLAGWKKLVDIVPSPHSGITFDCGVTREMGEDPVEVCRYFMQKDCINHVHYRNVRVQKPYEKYAEVFIDEGQVDMFGVMRELVRLKYPRMMYPEHPRALDIDHDEAVATSSVFKSTYPGGGSYTSYAFNIGYARAMMQAALSM